MNCYRPASAVATAALALAWALLGTGCVTVAPAAAPAAAVAATAGPVAARAASGPAAAASSVAPGGVQPGGPPASSLQPHANIIRDAKKIDGLFTLYQKDEKVWLELKADDFGKPFFLSPKVASGIGEAGLFGAMFDAAQVVEFRRIHNQVQLIARNTRFRAPAGTPESRSLAVAFSPSLLASATVASQPHPVSKALLVEANSLFLNDMLALAIDLQRTYRQGYVFDPRNSAITTVRGTPERVVIELLAHYATGSISAGAPGATPAPSVPRSLPDVRSLFATVQYALTALPEVPMAPRKADPRIGHFTSLQNDFGDDVAASPVQRHVNRWRLEKKDPAAAISEPVKPLVYWLDRTIPLKYRDAIRRGILEWNTAFERIGFKDAIEVRVQPDDADFDTLDVGYAAVRWTSNSAPQFDALAQTHVDPRSGEILGASVNIESFASRNQRAVRLQVLSAVDATRLMQGGPAEGDAPVRIDPQACAVADEAAAQMAYTLDVLAAREEADPGGVRAQQFVLDFMQWLTMHEVGHTLGLRHNFSASHVYTDAELSDPAFTHSHGIGGSVMDYLPANLAAPGAPATQVFQTVLGPYDF
jgi:Met-zincin/Domain of unknown function (DUF5117)